VRGREGTKGDSLIKRAVGSKKIKKKGRGLEGERSMSLADADSSDRNLLGTTLPRRYADRWNAAT